MVGHRQKAGRWIQESVCWPAWSDAEVPCGTVEQQRESPAAKSAGVHAIDKNIVYKFLRTNLAS